MLSYRERALAPNPRPYTSGSRLCDIVSTYGHVVQSSEPSSRAGPAPSVETATPCGLVTLVVSYHRRHRSLFSCLWCPNLSSLFSRLGLSSLHCHISFAPPLRGSCRFSTSAYTLAAFTSLVCLQLSMNLSASSLSTSIDPARHYTLRKKEHTGVAAAYP